MSQTNGQATGKSGWKIDELAHLSGISVDTIRYYSREGLLPGAQRDGRGLSYGPSHLERLKQIRQLQEKHISLAAIRDLLDEGRLELLQRLLDRGEKELSRDEFRAQSGLGTELVERLETMGFMSSPENRATAMYDGLDLTAARSIKSLIEAGMPEAVLLLLAGIYIRQMGSLRQELLASFGEPLSGAVPGLTSAEIEEFVTSTSGQLETYLDHFEVLLTYLHRRTLESLAVEAVEVAQLAPAMAAGDMT